MQSHNPKKGPEITWVFACIRNRLINFCKEEYKAKRFGKIDWYYTCIEEPEYEFFNQDFENLTEDTKTIVDMVLEDSLPYALPPRLVFGVMRKSLRKTGWSQPRIERGIRNLKIELS